MTQNTTHECCTTANDCCTNANDCCHEAERCDMPEKMLALADQAWMEAVKDKMKQVITKNCGEQLEALAELVVNANKEKWHTKIGQKVQHEAYRNAMRDLFTGGCDK